MATMRDAANQVGACVGAVSTVLQKGGVGVRAGCARSACRPQAGGTCSSLRNPKWKMRALRGAAFSAA